MRVQQLPGMDGTGRERCAVGAECLQTGRPRWWAFPFGLSPEGSPWKPVRLGVLDGGVRGACLSQTLCPRTGVETGASLTSGWTQTSADPSPGGPGGGL